MFTLSNSSSSTKILQRKLVFRIHNPKGTCQKNSQRLRLTQDPWTKSWVHLTVNRRNLENILYQNILTAWSPFFIISDLLWSIFNRMWQQTCSWHKVLWLKSWSTQPEHKYQFKHFNSYSIHTLLKFKRANLETLEHWWEWKAEGNFVFLIRCTSPFHPPSEPFAKTGQKMWHKCEELRHT